LADRKEVPRMSRKDWVIAGLMLVAACAVAGCVFLLMQGQCVV
jgi:hypothetical protein